MTTLAERILKWDLSSESPITPQMTYGEIHKRILYYNKTHYCQYLPTQNARHPDFDRRLLHWLDNVVDEEQQRLLFELLPRIAFFSREDFVKLHQSAFEGPILRWILDTSGISITDPNLNEKLSEESQHHTWYCPLSDSLRINDFHNVNQLGGIDHRPDWRSMAKFGDHQKISTYMKNHRNSRSEPTPLKRVVIIEDFIGSGVQSNDTSKFIETFSKFAPVLVVALIACPEGAANWRAMENRPQFAFVPVIELKPIDMINQSRINENGFEGQIARLARDSYNLVVGNNSMHPRPYSEYGFPGPNGTGATVSLYSNTPANTLPLIQHSSDTWQAIFPRSARIR